MKKFIVISCALLLSVQSMHCMKPDDLNNPPRFIPTQEDVENPGNDFAHMCHPTQEEIEQMVAAFSLLTPNSTSLFPVPASLNVAGDVNRSRQLSSPASENPASLENQLANMLPKLGSLLTTITHTINEEEKTGTLDLKPFRTSATTLMQEMSLTQSHYVVCLDNPTHQGIVQKFTDYNNGFIIAGDEFYEKYLADANSTLLRRTVAHPVYNRLQGATQTTITNIQILEKKYQKNAEELHNQGLSFLEGVAALQKSLEDTRKRLEK